MNEDKKILKVALDVPIDQLFDYLSDGSSVLLGQQVKVPFGKRVVIGVVCEFADSSSLSANKLKKIISTDNEVLCDKELLHLIKFSANYYHHPIGQSILSIIPTHIKQDKNVILKKEMIYKATSKLTKDWVMAIPNRQQTKKKLADILITQSIRQSSLKTIASNATKVIQDLKLLGICSEEEWSPKIENNEDNAPTLNKEQIAAINQINKDKFFHPWLLFGVTASGKTEVYLRLAEDCIRKNKAVLILVPEINLTPQLLSRFEDRFDGEIGLYHSRQTPSKRLKIWLKAKFGNIKIIIGTRSAVLMPLKDIGLIIIDEEHDQSFRQSEGFKFSARDLGIKRSQLQDIPIVLGSATPSLQSLKLVGEKKFKKVDILSRVDGRKPPKLIALDINNSPLIGGLAMETISVMQNVINKGEQVLVFINRRGFAPLYQCGSCGWVAECKSCDTNLVFHQSRNRLICHRCESAYALNKCCPVCNQDEFHFHGVGTERVEEVLESSFPKTSIIRVDHDSTKKVGAMEAIVKKIHSSEAAILVGTQMLAKGHDFPKVTLSVILNADNGLISPEINALEKISQLLIQVSGRAGRNNNLAKVIIQTRYPDDINLNKIKTGNYMNFAKQ